MAPLTDRWSDRRAEQRLTAERLPWRRHALLRPGQPVVLLNINSRAALVESNVRLRPGAHTELLLHGVGDRKIIRGHLDRCHVAALEPLRYRGVLLFDHRLVFDGDGIGVVSRNCAPARAVPDFVSTNYSQNRRPDTND